MTVHELYEKLKMYFGEESNCKVCDILITKFKIFDKDAFSFNYKNTYFTITESMGWDITDKILIDINNELRSELRKKNIGDIIK